MQDTVALVISAAVIVFLAGYGISVWKARAAANDREACALTAH
jgi:hypothetical protein